MTEAALIFRMQCLETTKSRAYIQCNELTDLYKMQSVSTNRDGKAHSLILGCYDTSPYSSIRVGADSVSAMTTLSLNILTSSTPYISQQFMGESSLSDGTLSRVDVAICPDCYDQLPRYTEPSPEFYTQLNTYIDRIERCTGEIYSADLERVIEDIRQYYNQAYPPHQEAEVWRLCHRQLLYTKMKGALLFVCNEYQWDPTWDSYLHWSFQYGMECKLQVFAPLIESFKRKQQLAATPYISMRTRKSELLSQLPETFTLDDLCRLKRQTDTTSSDEDIRRKAATQLRMWRVRQHVIQVNEEEWQKI